ncbi:hypothetical protein AQ490_13435 [Wenjunlia vitaminophila]|uniref:Uncharacterized protein n=1 Tax=Wenjunlia vitaminophila TaxID=76728 RepID=A0A0T6LY82_WENVI|nr:hypothetical protein [Wenjunlia vitaminophila]KRV50937.1 hypothetical protein AQ490_13435 [Wenjunlia vitaminophila]
MSEQHDGQPAPGPEPGAGAGPGVGAGAGRRPPEPEAIRFFGTSWVRHDGGYALRRVGVGVGALLAAGGVSLVWLLVLRGVQASQAGSFATVLLLGALVVCSLLAARRTWTLLTEGEEEAVGDQQSMAAVMFLGAVGALLAYFARNVVEAPGEALHRRAYERTGREDAKGAAGADRAAERRRRPR